MGDYVIPMRSRTEAEKGRRAARMRGIDAAVVSVEPSLTRSGCAFGLLVHGNDEMKVRRLLDQAGLSHGEMIGHMR